MTTHVHFHRRSFERQVNVTFPVLPIEHLADKRNALDRLLAEHLNRRMQHGGCVEVPADSKCPRSFGNRQQTALSALLAAFVLQARVLVDVASLECHSLLQFKARKRIWASSQATVAKVGTSTTCGPLSSSAVKWPPQLSSAGTCGIGTGTGTGL